MLPPSHHQWKESGRSETAAGLEALQDLICVLADELDAHADRALESGSEQAEGASAAKGIRWAAAYLRNAAREVHPHEGRPMAVEDGGARRR